MTAGRLQGERVADDTMHRLAAPLGVLAAVMVAWTFVAAVDPGRPGHYPTCPLLAVTGLTCPACGGLRAAHALAHGDVVGAVRFNVLVLALLPVAALLWGQWLLRRARGDATAGLALPARAASVVLVAAVAFAVVRNLAGGAFGP